MERKALEQQIQEFGQCPLQLFASPHPPRNPKKAAEFAERARVATAEADAAAAAAKAAGVGFGMGGQLQQLRQKEEDDEELLDELGGAWVDLGLTSGISSPEKRGGGGGSSRSPEAVAPGCRWEQSAGAKQKGAAPGGDDHGGPRSRHILGLIGESGEGAEGLGGSDGGGEDERCASHRNALEDERCYSHHNALDTQKEEKLSVLARGGVSTQFGAL